MADDERAWFARFLVRVAHLGVKCMSSGLFLVGKEALASLAELLIRLRKGGYVENRLHDLVICGHV